MKILIASTPADGGDGIAVEAQVLFYCPTATTEVIYNASMSAVVSYAIANGFNGIVRNVADFGSSYAQAATAYAAGIWIVWGHGSNSHILESTPTALIHNAIGIGFGISGANAGSYGPALDFFVDGGVTESASAGIIGGKMGQMLLDNPTKNFDDVRLAMQQASSNWPLFEADGGYGAIDLAAVQTRITTPLRDTLTDDPSGAYGAQIYATLDPLATAELSNIEEVQAELMNQLATINTLNGYRTSVKRVSNLGLDINKLTGALPTISVLIWNEEISIEDAGVKLWNSAGEIRLVGYCKQTDANALVHDMIKVVTAQAIANVQQASYRWVIPISKEDGKTIKVYRFELATDNAGWVGISFPIEIKNQSMTFQPR